MDHQQHKNTTLAETTTRIESIIGREKTKIQLQASKLSMRFKSTTRWEVPTYPLVIPDSINLANALEQDSALANLPKEILLAIFSDAEEDEAFKSGSLTMSCKRVCQTALLANPSKTHNLLEVLNWQRSDLKWCRGCGNNRPFDREYWNEKRHHCHAWSDLRNDTHQFSSAQARYEDHEIDMNIWIEEWCSTISPSAGIVQKRNSEDQWCPPCRAQWNWEMGMVEAALLFDTEFRNLKEQELLLRMGWGGESAQDPMRESMTYCG